MIKLIPDAVMDVGGLMQRGAAGASEMRCGLVEVWPGEGAPCRVTRELPAAPRGVCGRPGRPQPCLDPFHPWVLLGGWLEVPPPWGGGQGARGAGGGASRDTEWC